MFNDNTKVFLCITNAQIPGFLGELSYLLSVVLNFSRGGDVRQKETDILLLLTCRTSEQQVQEYYLYQMVYIGAL